MTSREIDSALARIEGDLARLHAYAGRPHPKRSHVEDRVHDLGMAVVALRKRLDAAVPPPDVPHPPPRTLADLLRARAALDGRIDRLMRSAATRLAPDLGCAPSAVAFACDGRAHVSPLADREAAPAWLALADAGEVGDEGGGA